MKAMEEEEVETWYEDEKQKLLDLYVDQLEKKVDKEVAEKEYTQKFDLLNQKYLSLIEKALARKGKKTPVEKIKEKMGIIVSKVMRK